MKSEIRPPAIKFRSSVRERNEDVICRPMAMPKAEAGCGGRGPRIDDAFPAPVVMPFGFGR